MLSRQKAQIVEEDIREIANAVDRAKVRRPDLDAGLLDFVGEVLTLGARGPLETEFIYRFQQFTSPVMAKGVEDTAFYCFNRMIGLNEVGSAPDINGITVSQFHDYQVKMQETHPLTMTTLSTHDTKRSDDVRARLAVLTEIPGRWKTALSRWSRRNARFKTGHYPDRNTEYFLYQTLIGAWPISSERLISYMEKATREAKQQTSWTQPNQGFEEALRLFIETILISKEFVSELEEFVARVTMPGRLNSLGQTLLNYTTPGIPDTYQGSELWDLHLVDPDNRGAVDYGIRSAMLAELQAGLSTEEIIRKVDSGMPKLWVIYSALKLRKTKPECFGVAAAYIPLSVEGSKKEHVVAFLRGDQVATIVSRWNVKLGGGWAGSIVNLPKAHWKNLLTGESVEGGRLRMQDILKRFPVALLVREEA